MKKLTALLLALLLLCGMSVTAYADEVTITTTVPERHTVTVVADGGDIVINGHVCGASVQVERQTEQTYWIIPDGGNTLEALYYNGEDVTDQVRGGVFTAPALIADATLKVVFKAAPPAQTDEEYDIGGTVTDEDGNPVPGATVDIGGNTGTTDEDGNFLIEDVPPGTWPIVITDEDGNIIGIGEITIEEPGSGDLTIEVDENGNPVITPGQDTENIDITLGIGDDGVISVMGAKDTTQPKPDAPKDPDKPGNSNKPGSSGGNSPQTGDSSHIWLWFILLILSCTGLMGTIIYNRKKREG